MDERGMVTTRWHQITARAASDPSGGCRFVHDRPLQAIALTIGVASWWARCSAGERTDAIALRLLTTGRAAL